jgi:hypothetical protein
MSAEPSTATVPSRLVDPICHSSVPDHPSLDHQSVLSKSGTPEIEILEVCFPEFAALPFEIRGRIWRLALPDYQNVVIIGGPLRKDLGLAHNGKEHHNGKYVSYRIPAMLHTCQQSRTEGLKKYTACFKEQLGIPVLFNLSKDLLLFTDDFRFLRFLQRSLNTFGANDNGLTNDLRFLGICGALNSQPGLYYDTARSRLPLFYNLQELILERGTAFPLEELRAAFVDSLKKTWADKREKAAKQLKGTVSAHEPELPKVSFFSSEEIKRLSNAETPTRL